MKAILFLLFTLLILTTGQTCWAQAPAEKSSEEEVPAEEVTADPPVKEKRKKNKKEKALAEDTPPEEFQTEETQPEKEKKDKSRKRHKEKEKEFESEELPAQEALTEEASVQTYKSDNKKDTWFRIFKMKQCPIKSCETRMVHIHNGKKFRGRKKLKIIQNPKTGELERVPVTDPAKRKKSKKVKKEHEYQKEFKLPEKSN